MLEFALPSPKDAALMVLEAAARLVECGTLAKDELHQSKRCRRCLDANKIRLLDINSVLSSGRRIQRR